MSVRLAGGTGRCPVGTLLRTCPAEGPGEPSPVRILMLSWRDAQHPEAGGSETFVERVSTRLVARGHEVTVLTSGHPDASPEEALAGVKHLRLGGRYSVFVRAATHLLRYGRG